MKKIIINTIIISLLAVTSIFADNHTTSNTNNNNQTTISQSVNQTAVVTITDLNGKTVYFSFQVKGTPPNSQDFFVRHSK